MDKEIMAHPKLFSIHTIKIIFQKTKPEHCGFRIKSKTIIR